MKGSVTRRLGAPALLLVAAIALTACGGGGDNDDLEQARDAAAELSAAATAAGRATGASGGGGVAASSTPTSNSSGSNQSSGSGAEAVDVCALISQDEAAETLGADVKEGEARANLSVVICTWVEVNEIGEISVEIRGGDPDVFTEYYELTEGEPVPGLGDRAKWDGLIGLEVLTSKYYVGVTTINFQEEEAALRERSIVLAQKVLERLP